MITIRGKQFAFSALNANDLDRFEEAFEEMARDGQAETARCERENVRLGDRLRAQARISMRGLDKILGAGASASLDLNENDASLIYDVIDELAAAIAAEKKRFATPVPQNRAQRRQQKKQKKHNQRPHSRSEGFAPAVQMVQRVDSKAARRAELLRELNALENE